MANSQIRTEIAQGWTKIDKQRVQSKSSCLWKWRAQTETRQSGMTGEGSEPGEPEVGVTHQEAQAPATLVTLAIGGRKKTWRE